MLLVLRQNVFISKSGHSRNGMGFVTLFVSTSMARVPAGPRRSRAGPDRWLCYTGPNGWYHTFTPLHNFFPPVPAFVKTSRKLPDLHSLILLLAGGTGSSTPRCPARQGAWRKGLLRWDRSPSSQNLQFQTLPERQLAAKLLPAPEAAGCQDLEELRLGLFNSTIAGLCRALCTHRCAGVPLPAVGRDPRPEPRGQPPPHGTQRGSASAACRLLGAAAPLQPPSPPCGARGRALGKPLSPFSQRREGTGRARRSPVAAGGKMPPLSAAAARAGGRPPSAAQGLSTWKAHLAGKGPPEGLICSAAGHSLRGTGLAGRGRSWAGLGAPARSKFSMRKLLPRLPKPGAAGRLRRAEEPTRSQ